MNAKMTYSFKKIIIICNTIVLCLFAVKYNTTYAQDWAKTKINELQRVDLRGLGYPRVNEIPENSSAITSLCTAHDGKIYGGTSGEESYMFLFDPKINKVRHLGKIEGEEGIHHSLVEGKDSCIYIGTGKNMFKKIPISKGGIGEDRLIDKSLWRDIKNHFQTYGGGHLYKYNPKQSNKNVKLPDMQCELEDLGIPLTNNSIYALTINSQRDEIYGITYPDGHFFIFNIDKKKFSDLGTIDEEIVFHGPERYWRTLSRALICDDSGKVFLSGNKGMLKYYEPKSGKLISTKIEVPGDYYYMHFYGDYTAIEYFAKAPNGIIYGGTTDGYLFSFDPDKMQVNNLGKVRESRRLRCLTVGNNGKVYLMAGEQSASRPCHFYCYNPYNGSFETLGLLIADRSPYYYRRGQQFDCMTTGLDGTIYIGESERRSHLFLFIPPGY